MSMTFHFNSLDSIANHFSDLANKARLVSANAKTKTDEIIAKREAWVWTEAARILRFTKLNELQFNPPVLEPDTSRLQTLQEFHD